jgi:multiple sugar transport system ATP-binding protein
MTMADQIVVLNEGRVEQVGTPVELYAQPRNLFVAHFIGAPPMNTLKGTLRRSGNGVAVETAPGAVIPLPGRSIDLPDGVPVTLGIRPEHAELGDGPFPITAETTEVLGSETIVHARDGGGGDFALALRGISRVKAGDKLSVRFPEHFVHLFDEAGTAVGALADWRDAYLT